MLPESKSEVLKLAQAFDAFGRAIGAGLLLGLVAFAIGFAFGVVRVVFVADAIGPTASIILELFVLLPVLWFVARSICDRWKIATYGARSVVGLTAVALLLSLEAVFAIGVMKQEPAAYIGSIKSPAGLIGLCGQLLLAWLPALSARQRPKSPSGMVRSLTTKHP